jgi:antitoxin MazE
MEKDFIILNPASTPRKGWSKAFQKMAERGEDKLLLNDVLTDEKFEKWK